MALPSDKKGFKIPDRYFEYFPQDFKRHLDGSLLHSNVAKPGFKVPESYFEELENRLQHRLHSRPKNIRPLWNNAVMKWGVAIAASMALILFLQTGTESPKPQFQDLARTEIEDYIEIRYSDLNAFELAESLSLEEITMGDLMEDIPNDAQILNYLERKYEAYDHFNLHNDE